jgi:hypothetical protein
MSAVARRISGDPSATTAQAGLRMTGAGGLLLTVDNKRLMLSDVANKELAWPPPAPTASRETSTC